MSSEGERKKSTVPPSSSRVPADLQINILSRLPIKTLARFRCVSKSWLNLLTNNPQFIKMYLTHITKSNNPNIILTESLGTNAVVYTGPECSQSISLKSPVNRSHELVGCCNGIICLKHSRFDHGMHIWNPSTHEHCHIPACPAVYDKIAYFGFGYDEINNQYKVVIICHSSHVYVYTLGSDAWRTVGKIPSHLYVGDDREQSSVFVNGKLHWIVLEQHNYYRNVVLSFDVKDEVFGLMLLPENDFRYLGVYADSLCLFLNHSCYSQNVTSLNLNLWVMKKYGEVGSWEKVFEIKQSDGPRMSEKMRLVGIRNNGETIVCRIAQRLLFYSLEGGLIKEIECPLSCDCQASSYFPSIVSPRVITGGVAHQEIEHAH